MEASTAGCRTPKWVIPEAIFARLVTWPSAPASTAKSLVPQRSLSQTVPSPSCSAARAWSRAGRGSDTRPGSTYAPSSAGLIGRAVAAAAGAWDEVTSTILTLCVRKGEPWDSPASVGCGRCCRRLGVGYRVAVDGEPAVGDP